LSNIYFKAKSRDRLFRLFLLAYSSFLRAFGAGIFNHNGHNGFFTMGTMAFASFSF